MFLSTKYDKLIYILICGGIALAETNAVRFINAYNSIDQSLRSIYNFRRNISFADMIRRSVPLNSVVRRYEDKLIDYARLRNAIIHNSTEEMIIAEPHDDVVADIEHIAQLVSSPPTVLQSIPRKEVFVLDGNTPLKKAIELVASTGFKTIPIYQDDRLVSIIHSSRIVDVLGDIIKQGKNIDEYCASTPVIDAISSQDIDKTFTIRGERLTVQEALDIFYNNRKMLAIVITKKGNFLERPISILTVADIIDLNKIVDDYDVRS